MKSAQEENITYWENRLVQFKGDKVYPFMEEYVRRLKEELKEV